MGEAKVMRVDRWLWTARWFKTRALATQAVAGGKVRLNGRRVKPAADLRAGEELEIVRGPYTYVVVVRGLAERRRSAAEAALLYEETEESREAREVRRIQMRDVPVPSYEGKGRPTKRERRKLERARRRPPD
ncbi:MAG TPA: RNA-binding S4 domain-containing protein [Gemmatimonadota bacterium]|nr:RNA-binding S4 domain-containing protein [Gemmatimonadota bacterium]